MSAFDQANLLLRQAAEALDSKQYPQAEALQRRAVDLLDEHCAEAPNTALAWERLAYIHFIQGKFELAANEYQAALKLYGDHPSEDSTAVLRVLHSLGQSQFNQQKYEMAEGSLRRALVLAESLPEDTGYRARSLYRLGFLLYFVGRYRESEPYLLRALPLYERAYGPANLETVEVLTRIALTYKHCPEIGKDAELYFRKAVDNIEPQGETRQTHLENLYRLAEYVAESGKVEAADSLFSRLLDLLKSGGLDKSTSHWVVSGCVEYFKSRGKNEAVTELAAADKLYDAYGEIVNTRLNHAVETLLEDDPEFAESLFHSANLLIFKGEYVEAETKLRRVLDCYQKVYGSQSLQVATALNRICVVERLLKKLEYANVAIERALVIAHECFPNHVVYPRTLENLALLRQAEGKTGEATETYDRSVREMEKICGFPSYESAEVLYRQSGYLFRAHQLGLAETAIRRAIAVMDGIEELSDLEKSDYFSTLASILEAQGHASEAEEMRERAKILFEKGEWENRSEE